MCNDVHRLFVCVFKISVKILAQIESNGFRHSVRTVCEKLFKCNNNVVSLRDNVYLNMKMSKQRHHLSRNCLRMLNFCMLK